MHRRIAARLDGSEASAPAEDEDLVAAWHNATSTVKAALADPASASLSVGGRFGDTTFEQLVGGLVCADTLVHTWDLVRATGQDERLNADATAVALSFLIPRDEQIRVSGGFATKIEPPAGADEQTRLLCFAGRKL